MSYNEQQDALNNKKVKPKTRFLATFWQPKWAIG